MTTAYQRHKARVAARDRHQSAQGRELPPIPPIADPARRTAAGRDFRIFCESYFPQIFFLPWSDDHLRVIAKVQTAVTRGGLFAVAMPRGSGKTSLCKSACLWAILYGHRNFIALIGSCESHAQTMLHDLKIALETNPILQADFPEVCLPIAALDGIANRCKGQLYRGRRTYIEWTSDKIVLPTIPGSRASGAIVTVAGITGHIRGMAHQRPDGRIARPDLVIIDDPQTDESARSPSQTAARQAVIAGAILGLAGPKKKIAGIMPCTVIHPGDLADIILNRDLHPEWNGERMKLLYEMPKRMDLWETYAQIRADSLRAGRGLADATTFYAKHRKEMDEGARPAWPQHYNPDELSALQYAMNLLFQDEAAFLAEYQNEPKPPQTAQATAAPPDVAQRLSRIPRGQVPAEATTVTAFIDVHRRLLYYALVAWADAFTAWVIDYGAWPPQKLRYFRAADAKPSLEVAYPNHSIESAIYRGLADLSERLLRPHPRVNGPPADIERILIDAGWGPTTETIYTFCRESKHAAYIMPSFGRYIGAAATPMNEYKKRPGERSGHYWRIPAPGAGRPVRHVLYDANYWKTFIIRRLQTPMGSKGNMTLFGTNPSDHQLIADHLNAEYAVDVTANGRTVTEWKLKPAHPDNHLFDCLAGAAVAASIAGISDITAPQPTQRRVIKLSTLQQLKR